MNWYKNMIIRLSAIQGEYWIDDSGNSMYADGDIGDMNHSAYVIQSIQSKYADDNFDKGEYIDWDGYKRFIAQEKIAEAHADPAVMQEVMKIMNIRSPEEMSTMDIDELVIYLLKEQGMTDEEISIAEGRGDDRNYAMKNWRWKRVANNEIQTWTLDLEDLKIIANGLYDAYQEDVNLKVTFNIEVVSTKDYIQDISFQKMEKVLKSGNLFLLREHTDMFFMQRYKNYYKNQPA